VTQRSFLLNKSFVYCVTIWFHQSIHISLGENNMKKPLFSVMSVLVVIALLVGSCDKKSTEPTSEKPNIPVLVFSQPGFASD